MFNAQTLPKQWGGATVKLPKISFGKAGIISFNKAACQILELNPGDKIALAQDEDDLANWYIFKHPDGYELRGKDFDKIGSLTFNHKTLFISFVDSFEFDQNASYTFLISGQPTIIEKHKCWGILVTSNN
jgi:hypothetical protein